MNLLRVEARDTSEERRAIGRLSRAHIELAYAAIKSKSNLQIGLQIFAIKRDGARSRDRTIGLQNSLLPARHCFRDTVLVLVVRVFNNVSTRNSIFKM